jgi:4-amino-4-deoxy-L-arabinose transferase-like glycosyltransferase
VRGPAGDAPWTRPALLGLLVATAVLYLWDLTASGYANQFYAAAVQAGTQSWKAFLFGSLDPGNAITVDKPPASLWVMGLAARIFGFSGASVLVPQVLEGVASVALLYAAVRRWAGPRTGLLAAGALAVTPVAVLMFRFDNPDALLVLLLVAGAYCLVRAAEAGSTRWLLLAGVALGFGFITKMLQAFLVLPAFALTYLVVAPTPLPRRILQLLAGGAAMVAAGGWWVLVTVLWPASSRPYIGGSTNNSVLQLALGYNGLSRILGRGGGPGGGGATMRDLVQRSAEANGGRGGGAALAGGFGGSPGPGRLFSSSFGGQISWLLPAAGLAFVAGLWLTRRRPRTDVERGALLLWGLWTLVTAAVFSFMSGTIHQYYTVALAPGIAGTTAVGGRLLWHQRRTLFGALGLAAMVAVTGAWSVVLLRRVPGWQPWLAWAVAIGAVVAMVALLAGPLAGRVSRRARVGLGVATAVGSLLAVAGGSVGYSVQTVATPHAGAIPLAGPSTTGGGFGAALGGGRGGAGGGGAFGGGTLPAGEVAALKATTSRWALAEVGAPGAAAAELASGKAVMAIGGFMGSDPSPTLAQFQAYVAKGEVRYFSAAGRGFGGTRGGFPGGAGGFPGGAGDRPGGMPGFGGRGGVGGFGGSGQSAAITQWVERNFRTVQVGGVTLYDLAQPRGA